MKAGIFSSTKENIKAVDNVDIEIRKGETFRLVGESGCGKTTLGRVLIHLIPPTAGTLVFMGSDLTKINKSELRKLRPHMQIVFQDPSSSLNPRMTLKTIIGEPLKINKRFKGESLNAKVLELLSTVGLDEQHMYRYPHEFSGGQKQRIGVARALALNPDFIVLDEPTSLPDVSVQAQILNLFKDLQEKFQLTYLFITHDLSVIKYISDRVAVMYFCIATLKEGDVFGFMSFIDGGEHNATIISDQQTELIVLRRPDFDRLAVDHPLIASKILQRVAAHLASIVRVMNSQYLDVMHLMFGRARQNVKGAPGAC